MELSEAVVRSLRRGRTIDLHYEAISEEASFKSIMTSTGCMILWAPADPAAGPRRPGPGHQLDDLPRLPDPAGARALRGPSDASVRDREGGEG